MFERLAQFERIVVTGPHRSGTTICGEMIAKDLGYRSLREEAFGWSNEENFLRWLGESKVVLQAPFLAHMMHYLKEYVSEASVCVIMMKRAIPDILASQARMMEQFGTGGGIALYRLRKFHAESPGPEIVYENWEEQKQVIRYWEEVEYESLKSHPLWIGTRADFHFRQTA